MNTSVTDLYAAMSPRKPAVRMMLHSVAAMTLLAVWASVAPIHQSVSHRVEIVPRNGETILAGSIEPSSSYGGLVAEVSVAQSQDVKEGDILLRFDKREIEIRKGGEKTNLKNLFCELEANTTAKTIALKTHKASVEEIEAQLNAEKQREKRSEDEQRINIRQAKLECVRATKEYQRALKLRSSNAVSESELETLQATHAAAKEKLSLAELPLPESKQIEFERRLDSLKSLHLETMHRIDTERLKLTARISEVQHEVEMLDLKIQQSEIVSPRDGVVSGCSVRKGDWLPPGKVGISVSESGYVAEAILPSRLICDVSVGNHAVILLDGVDWVVHGSLDAKVIEVSPDLCKKESVLGDGSTQVVDGYRVLLQLESTDEFEKWNNVRLGMTGTVQIETGKQKLATWLVEKAVGNDWFAIR